MASILAFKPQDLPIITAVSWEDALNNYLTIESPTTKRRLKLKILDTVFLQSDSANGFIIASWVYTSKRGGDVAKRNDLEALQLSHVCDRFCRFALSNQANSRGPRIAAVAYKDDEVSGTLAKKNLTAENFKLAIQGNPYKAEHIENAIILLRSAKYLQCYLRPSLGDDAGWRVVVTSRLDPDVLVENENGENADDFIYFFITICDKKITFKIGLFAREGTSQKNSIIIPFSEWKMKSSEFDNARDLICAASEKLIRHITYFPFDTPQSRYSHTLVVSLTADFILDENKQLWLISIPAMEISSSGLEIHDGTEAKKNARVLSSGSTRNLPAIPTKRVGVDPHKSSEWNATSNSNERLRTISSNQYNRKQTSSDSCLKGVAAMDAENDSTQQKELHTLNQEDSALQNQDIYSRPLIEMNKRTELTPTCEQSRCTTQELNRFKMDSMKRMQCKEEEHRLVQLELQSQLSIYKAECADLKEKLKLSVHGENEDEGKDNMTGAQLFLLEKLQNYHLELTASQQKWGEEKRAIMSANAATQQELSAKHRLQLSQVRSVLVASEDENRSQKELSRELEKEKASLLKQVADLIKKDSESNILMERMHKEIEAHELNQSIQVAASAGVIADSIVCRAETNSENVKSTSDPIIRSLVNKLAYLKAQLTSEATLKDDYAATIESLRLEKDVMFSTSQEQLRAIIDQKNKDVALIRQQMLATNEGTLKEISILKDQVGDLQIKLGDAVRGLALAQHKETSARRDSENEKVRAEAAHSELFKIHNELQVCQKALSQNDLSSHAAINEAMLRRAENERKYMTTQLESEVAFKKELLEKLAVAEENLQETVNSWKIEVQFLKEKLRSETLIRSNVETEFIGKNQILLSEIEDQNRQLDELKQVYVQAREQLRIEEVATEQIRATNQRLSEELHAVQDELSYAKKVTEETVSRHTETTRLISTSIEMADESCSKEIESLRQETTNALREASQAKVEMLHLQSKTMEQVQQALRTCAAQLLVSASLSIARKKKRRFFVIWSTRVLELRFLAYHQSAIERVANEMEHDTMIKYEQLLSSTLHQVSFERDSEIKLLKSALEKVDTFLKDEKKTRIQKSHGSIEKLSSSGADTRQSIWDVIGLRLRDILEKAEEDRECIISSILKEEKCERNHALQLAAAENEKLMNQVKSAHLSEMDAQIKLAVAEVQREDNIVKRRLEENIHELTSTILRVRAEAEAEAESLRVSADASVQKYRVEAETKAEHERETWRKTMADALVEQAEKNSAETKRALEAVEEQFMERVGRALKELQKACELEKALDVRLVKEGCDARLLALQKMFGTIQEEKRDLESKLSDASCLVKKNGDTISDLRQTIGTMQLHFSFDRMRFVAAGLKFHGQCIVDMKSKDEALRAAVNEVRLDFESKMQPLFGQIYILQNVIVSYKNLHALMNDTLVNYKREVLQEHQAKSKTVVTELSSISLKQEELENRRLLVREQMKSMEAKLRSLEKEMEEHSKTSTLQGGRVNAAHAKKKRRLNDEYEKLIDDIDSKREEQSVIDESIRELSFQKDETDGMVKSLERALVEVLVEQQKRMLEILSKLRAI